MADCNCSLQNATMALSVAVQRAREHLLSGGAGPVAAGLARMRLEGGPGAEAEGARATLEEAQSEDGSWAGSLGATARSLLLLRGLGADADASGQAGVAWLRQRRREGASYLAGCDAERHRQSLCGHFAGGLFAPTAADGDPPSCSLLGVRVEGRAASLVLSCMALVAEEAWGAAARDAALHAAALRRMVLERDSWTSTASEPIPAFLAAVRALLPFGTDDGAVWHALVVTLRSQRADGSWPDTDTFLVLDVLLGAAARGYGGASLDRGLARAAELLAVTQQAQGGWSREAVGADLDSAAFGVPRDLVGLLALEHASGSTSTPDAEE